MLSDINALEQFPRQIARGRGAEEISDRQSNHTRYPENHRIHLDALTSDNHHLVVSAFVDAIYGSKSAFEQYYCNFGLNPKYQQRLHEAGLRIIGRDANGEARILTLPNHRFFVATLFVMAGTRGDECRNA